ncbi:MAG: EAL domain-containing protein [Gemmatimonadota bacterium]
MKPADSIDVLLIEDDRADARHTEIALKRVLPHSSMRVAESVLSGLDQLREAEPDVILLDLGLPDSQGLEGLQEILPVVSGVPVIVQSGLDDDQVAMEALRAGAQDYIRKGEPPEVLGRSIQYSVQRSRVTQSLTRSARFDPVTGLTNRAHFMSLLGHAVGRARRTRSSVGVLFLDLDHFKNINDSLGHMVGDIVLKRVAGRLETCVRTSDVVARLGGDEFILMVEGVADAQLARLAEKVLDSVSRPILVEGMEMIMTASIGIAGCPGAGSDANALLTQADTAMYRAKGSGRNKYRFFTDEMNAEVRKAFDLEMKLRKALSRNEFGLVYQPIVDRTTEKVQAVEALIRWYPEGRHKPVSPAEFLPILERTGLIREVGEWGLRTACTQCVEWQRDLDPDLRVAVNVSPVQLATPGFATLAEEILDETGLSAASLQIEITEEVLLQDTDTNIQTLTALRALGVGVAIDDFGSGYSSLNYLTAFPFDTVKIDRAFVAKVTAAPDDALLTAGIIGIARALGRTTIAEGVETADQLEFLSRHPCDGIQGFYFSRPLTVSDFEDFHALRASSRTRRSPLDRRARPGGGLGAPSALH